jgi:hypothetical protein
MGSMVLPLYLLLIIPYFTYFPSLYRFLYRDTDSVTLYQSYQMDRYRRNPIYNCFPQVLS